MVVLGTQDITSTVANSFILLPVGYRLFELEFTSLLPTVDAAQLQGSLSINGGSTWIGGTSYAYEGIYNNSLTAVLATGSTSYGFMYLGAIATTAVAECQVRVKLYPGTAALRPTWLADSGGYSTSIAALFKNNVTGIMLANGPVNAIQYSFSPGSIAQAFLTVKGVV